MRAFTLTFVFLSSIALTACGSDDTSTNPIDQDAGADTAIVDSGAHDSSVADTHADGTTDATPDGSDTATTDASEAGGDSTTADSATDDTATSDDSTASDTLVDVGLETGGTCHSDGDCAPGLKCCSGGAPGTKLCLAPTDAGTCPLVP